MAKAQKINNDLLLEAVVKYSDICKGKIKYKELAEWSAANIEGLEEVRDYMFSRPITETDPSTGKKKSQDRPCTIRIKEINASRTVTADIATNILIQVSNVETFMSLPRAEQRRAILATREQVTSLTQRNIYLERENKRIVSADEDLKTFAAELEARLLTVAETHELLKKHINYIRKFTDAAQRRQALEQIGITEEGFQLLVNQESLQIEEAFSFGDAIKKFQKTAEQIDETPLIISSEGSNSLSDDILKGLDF